jgi:hypothetical protein
VRNRGVIPPSFKDAHKRGPQNPAAQSGRLRLLRHEYGWHELARLHEVYIRLGNASDDLSIGQHEDHQGLVPDLTQDRSMDRQHMGSPLARAMGLGSAKEGAEHWWMQRVSAVALVPLTLWFVASIIAWLRTPLASVSMILRRAVLSHRAWAEGRDRGLRPLRC